MGEGLAKQAKTLTDKQIKRALAEVATHRYPERDRVMVLLSVKSGLRAKEIAMVTWGTATDAAIACFTSSTFSCDIACSLKAAARRPV